MADFYLKSGSGVAEFAQSTAYVGGNRIVPKRSDVGTNHLVAKRWVWECTTAGTSAAAEPTWPAAATQDTTTVVSGGATFTARKPGFSSGTTIDWTFATIYVDYLVNASGAIAAGDTVFVSSAHNESVTGAVTVEGPGTAAAPHRIVSVTENGATRPVTKTRGAIFTTTGSIRFLSNAAKAGQYYFGLIARPGNGVATAQYAEFGGAGTNSDNFAVVERCAADILTTENTAASRASIGADGAGRGTIRVYDFEVAFAAAQQCVNINGFDTEINGLSKYAAGGSATPTGSSNGLFRANGCKYPKIRNLDASAWGTAIVILDAANNANWDIDKVKLPASWTGTLIATYFGLWSQNYRAVVTHYREKYGIRIDHPYHGVMAESTVVRRTNGASILGQALSWAFNTTADTSPASPLFTHGLVYKVLAANVGLAHTFTFEAIANVASAVQNTELWAEADYQDHATDQPGVVSTSFVDPITSSALAASTEAWDGGVTARANSTAYALGATVKVATNAGRVFFCTTAGTTAASEPAGYATAADGDSVTDGTAVFRAGRRVKFTVAVTPAAEGYIKLRMFVGKASVTAPGIFVDPKFTVAAA